MYPTARPAMAAEPEDRMEAKAASLNGVATFSHAARANSSSGQVARRAQVLIGRIKIFLSTPPTSLVERCLASAAAGVRLLERCLACEADFKRVARDTSAMAEQVRDRL